MTDKTPGNFLYLGLIALILPNAKIIHCRRHPLDTALSCLTQYFSPTKPFTNSLDGIGRYHAAYEKLIAHWADVLAGRVFDVHYVRIDVRERESGAIFSITNSGPGIEPEETDEVFDAFSARRVDQQIVGSDMSMALARAIMRAHGGDLGIESAPGKETTCSGSLPVHSAAAVPSSDS